MVTNYDLVRKSMGVSAGPVVYRLDICDQDGAMELDVAPGPG
mgnify:CR=1 FL=1